MPLPNHEYKADIQLPAWLNTSVKSQQPAVSGNIKKTKERFLEKTLYNVISFVRDAMFNEVASEGNGLIQKIEPRLKIVTLLICIVVLSLQKTAGGAAVFLFAGILAAFLSGIPLLFFIKKLLPAALLTFFIALPATLNLFIDGEPLLVLYRFENTLHSGPATLPGTLAITRQGVNSAAILFLRATASVSLVLLMAMTTPPNRFIKALSALVPGAMGTVVSVSYRYIYFLIKKVELFVMGFKSRSLSATKARGSRHWAASRISLLFSISMGLSKELAMAMESRGYKETGAGVRRAEVRIKDFSRVDILWFIATMTFAGVMFWKSLI